MSDYHDEPRVFAGAASETAGDAQPGADVEIEATFSAECVKHLEPPRARARVEGDVERLDEMIRENLPSQVRAGETYEHVHARRQVGGRLRSRSVREAGDDGG